MVSELYYPEETSTGYFLTGIAEALATEFDVRVICSQPTYSARGTIAPARETRLGVHIYRYWGARLDKNNLLLRLVNAATIAISLFLAASRRVSRGDCVLVVTNPPILPFLVVLAAKARGANTLLLVHDVYPEVLVASGLSDRNSVLVRAVGGLSRWLYRQVDTRIVLGRDMQRLVNARLSNPAGDSTTVIIPNWGDIQAVASQDRHANRLLSELGLANKFVVQFMGNIGRTHNIDLVVEAARRLQKNSDIHFLIVGEGARRKWLETAVSSDGLPNITLLPPCPRDELADYLNACDVSVIGLLPGMQGVSVPSRLYNVMAAGKPVIALVDADSEVALVIEEERSGWVVAQDDAEALVNAIVRAHDDSDSVATRGKNARRAAEQKYSRERVGQKFLEVVKSACVRGNKLGA